MMRFKHYLLEYELTKDIAPSHVAETDVDGSNHEVKELGHVDGHRVVHYKAKGKGMSHTFVTNDKGETVGHIGHKKTPSTKGARLAISDVTKTPGSKFGMGNVLHHLIGHGHELESDNTNTEAGAHKMLMFLAQRHDVHSHIEDGYGEKIHHEGDITSPENQKKYTTRSTDKDFMDDNNHKRILVFRKK